jgi:hypothetical protein
MPASVCLVLALAACGGGGAGASRTLNASTTTKPVALTAAEFRQKANAICFDLYRTKVPKGVSAGLVAASM